MPGAGDAAFSRQGKTLWTARRRRGAAKTRSANACLATARTASRTQAHGHDCSNHRQREEAESKPETDVDKEAEAEEDVILAACNHVHGADADYAAISRSEGAAPRHAAALPRGGLLRAVRSRRRDSGEGAWAHADEP